MTKQTKSISINVLSALIVLMSLFNGIIGGTTAWFTAEHKNGIYIQMEIGDLKLKLYKTSVAANNLVYTYEENESMGEANQSFVPLAGEIKPDEFNSLVIILSNEDAGSASMYIRYKLEMYRRSQGDEPDLLVPIDITQYVPTGSGANRFRAHSDGYCYYQTATGASAGSYSSSYNARLLKNETAQLFTGFTVPYSSFLDRTGNLIDGSDSLYIKLTVEASVTSGF